MISILALALMIQAQPVTPVKAADLKAAPGPIAPAYPDPAGGMGSVDRIAMKMRRTSRHNNVRALDVPAGTLAVEDQIKDVAGWKAYRVSVPGNSTVKVRLTGDHQAWFLVKAVNHWGRLEEGMLQNVIPTGNPEASYKNPKNETSTIYFLVDTKDSDSWSDPYTLLFTWE